MVWVGMKCAILENQLMIVSIALKPSDSGRPTTKLYAISSQGCSGIGSGFRRPMGSWLTGFDWMQVSQCDT